ncbi:DUF7507 domain-containing protein [Algoriphagus sp. oki45]|uniref:DUF7507 domain-containing protein n=1 Tax=Algoriphagus sp. oki45 TaxID=3067294 RepID=UPI0030C6A059
MASASGNGVTSNTDTETVDATQSPDLSILKSVKSNEDILGGDLIFEITVTNTGNVTLYDIYVEDIETGDNWIIDELVPEEDDTREVVVKITQELIDGRCYENTAIAEVREYFIDARVVPGQGQQLPYEVILSDESSAEACFTQTPELTILKEITGGDPYSLVGDEVEYKYIVTNRGNVTLTGPFTVEDDKIGTIADPANTASLAPGEEIIFTASYTIGEGDLVAGSVTNIATGQGFFGQDEIESDPDQETATSRFNEILAVDDNAGTFQFSVNPQVSSVNALTNDELKGGPATPANVVLTTVTPDPTGTLTVDANGVITIAANPQAGDYQLTYRITEVGNPSNFDEAVITVTVEPLLGLIEVDEYCELDAPYLRWLLSPVNFDLQDLAPNDPTPLTMTWYDKDDNVIIEYENIGLEGFMLFPGADTLPGGYGSAWPGWKFENMQWVSGQFNFYQVREPGAYVIFRLNPEVEVEVNYPGATEDCNPNPNPPIAEDDDMTAIPVFEFGFDNIVNVLDNDRLLDGTSPLNTTLVDIFEVTQSTPGALILDPATGLVDVAPGLTPGIYTLEYRICTNPNPTNCDTAIVTVRVVSPGILVEKSVLENDNQVDGFITYEIKVTNTGDVELFNIEVKDDLTGEMWTISSLAPQATWTETTQLEITQELIDGLCVTNTAAATVYAEEIENDETLPAENGERRILISDEDSVEECFEINPAIALLKDGVFNDENQDGFGNVGETISYTFTVTNNGNVTLSNITVTDPLVTVSGGPISLAPGASDNTTFTATYVLTQDDIDAGYVVNTALAEGTAPNDEVVEDESSDPTPVEEPSTDCETCTETVIPQNPAIALLKDGVFNDENQDGFGNVGETISYTFTVTNTGNVTLSNITVTDPLVTVSGGPISLAPGASDNTTFTATYVLTQDDINAGYVVNTALAKGTSPKGVEVEDESSDPTPVEEPSTDCETCTETVIPQNPAIQVIKTDNGAQVDGEGDVITYTLTVTNTGNVTLTNVTVQDPLTQLDINVGTLAPGASTAVNTDYVVTQADVDAGFVLNTALTTGESPDGEDPEDDTDIETPVDRNPSIQVVKSDNGAQVDGEGDVITYTLTVTNTGNVTLTNVTVQDPLTQLDINVGTLAPGASTAVNTDYVVTQADVDAGFVLNTALTTGESPDGEDPEDDTEIETPIERNPSIQIVKSDNGAQVDGEGDVITYTLTVTNTGNVTLSNVTVQDPLTQLDINVGTLAPGASTAVNTDYVVTQADVDAGFVLNTALTSGDSPDEETPTDEDDEETPIERNPSIQIVKSDNGAQVDGEGDVITYTLTVTNTGNVTLTNVTVEDPLTGLDINVGTLAPGASTAVNTDYVVTQDDVDAGFVLNTALTSGDSPEGEEDPKDETEIETPIDRTSAITITKVADVEAVQDEGEVINYTIVVTNTGNTTLTELMVSDPLTGLEEIIGVLNPGDAVTFETSYTVTIEDIASQEAIVNVAKVTYTDPVTEEEVSDEADEIVEIACIDDTLITGILIDDTTGLPLAGVPVTLIPQESTPGEPLILVTGADGRYTFKDFAPGQYLLQVQDANLNSVRGLFPVQSSLFFTFIEACVFQTKNFNYETYGGTVLGDFVWYDINQDGIQNEWFDANDDGQVTLNDPTAGPISIRDWEWFDLNGDGRYDGPENEGELNKAGFGNDQSFNIMVTGPEGYESEIIVGVLGYWRERIDENRFGQYTATFINDTFIQQQASFMESTGKVKVLPNANGRMTDINGIRFEERCGLTTEPSVTKEVSANDRIHLDMDFGWRCLLTEVEIIANDDDFGSHFISFGGVIGNILDNDRLEGQRPDPADVDFEFTELDGIIGLLINDNGELSLVPNVNEVRDYTLRYVLRETDFPENNDDALVFFRILNDNVNLAVTKTSFEAEIYEGDEFEYEIVVSNIGGTPATGVTIEDNLPAGVTYLSSRVVSVSDPQIQVGSPAVSGSTVTWNVPFLPADGVITLRVRVQAGDAGQIQNVVTVDSEEDDTDDQNNRDTDVNTVLPFRIPNVITPNGDGDNDTFEIKGLGKFTDSEIVIFNRYGDHVLEKENYQNDWDAPGQVAGTYFYVLKLTDRSGRVHEFTGWIQVIKE